MLERIRPQFQWVKGQGRNNNVWKTRARNPVFERIGPKFQCLKGKGRNTNVWKDRAGIPVFKRMGLEFQQKKGRAGIPVFKRMCGNSNVWKDKAGIFQCSKGQHGNSYIQKDRTGIPMFIKIGQEFQCSKNSNHIWAMRQGCALYMAWTESILRLITVRVIKM